MEHGVIEREVRIEAPPGVVYEVITEPVHIAQWWGFDVELVAEAGTAGRMTRQRRERVGRRAGGRRRG